LILSCDTDVESGHKNYFVKYYGEDGDHQAIDMVVNSDGTMVLLGISEFPANSGVKKIYLVKTDAEGNILWEKTYGDGDEFPQDIESIPTGFVILSNVQTNSIDNYFDFKLIRVDFDGEKIDSLYFDLLYDQYARTVTPLQDGGFFVVGKTQDQDPDDDPTIPKPQLEDILFVRFDNTFLKANSSIDRVGGFSTGSAIKVFENPSGNFTYCAYSDELTEVDISPSITSYENNFIFRSFVNDPSSVNSTYIGSTTREDQMNSVSRGPDGFYSIGTSTLTSSKLIFVSKVVNTSGEPAEIFQRLIDSDTQFEGISISPLFSGCAVVGNKIDPADGLRDIWVTKIDAFTGGQLTGWETGVTFGSPSNDDVAATSQQLPNGDIVILGTMTLVNQSKIALIRLRDNGEF
jgi:hypothetical protein